MWAPRPQRTYGSLGLSSHGVSAPCGVLIRVCRQVVSFCSALRALSSHGTARVVLHAVVMKRLSLNLGLFVLALIVCVVACASPRGSSGVLTTATAGTVPSAPAVTNAVTTSALMAPPPIRLKYRGTNLSGGEFGKVPGTYGYDYGYPKTSDADYFAAAGMNIFRVGTRHERLQPQLKGPLDETELGRLQALVHYATAKGITVVIEPHNSWRFYDRVISETEAGWFWGLLGQRFKDNARVWFNLTNEPHDMTSEKVVALSNASLRELRRVGFKNMVLVAGNGWSGAHSWEAKWYGVPNAQAMLGVVDPASNMAIDVHQYLDANSSGGGGECVSPSIGVERLQGFVTWLRANKKLGFLGEIGAPNTPLCKEAVTRALAFVEEHYDVWVGWLWWSAGSRWTPTYPLSIQPLSNADGSLEERPQMTWLRPFLPAFCSR